MGYMNQSTGKNNIFYWNESSDYGYCDRTDVFNGYGDEYGCGVGSGFGDGYGDGLFHGDGSGTIDGCGSVCCDGYGGGDEYDVSTDYWLCLTEQPKVEGCGQYEK